MITKECIIERINFERDKFDLISRVRDGIYRLVYIRDGRQFDRAVYDTFDTCYPLPLVRKRPSKERSGRRMWRETTGAVLKLESLNFTAYLAYLRGEGFFIVPAIRRHVWTT